MSWTGSGLRLAAGEGETIRFDAVLTPLNVLEPEPNEVEPGP